VKKFLKWFTLIVPDGFGCLSISQAISIHTPGTLRQFIQSMLILTQPIHTARVNENEKLFENFDKF
jgi:hypothetical protein